MESATFVVWSRSRTRADVQAKRERDEHGAVGERDEAGKEPDSGSWCLCQLRRSLYTRACCDRVLRPLWARTYRSRTLDLG
jgi:hypothetical protein